MTSTTLLGRATRPASHEASPHLFRIGQVVRIKGGPPSEIYHITGTLPSQGNSLRYRIRNDDERHERVTTQDSLVPVYMSPSSNDATLMERTFGHG
ncbi:hypothetical protein ACHMW4_30290 [Mesorhizobium sp. UC22_110]|uniref:hypothetical protein n=1 Tax=Mesorhizobium sp. UC22_110 TaxID=3374552 RepID=UPI0037567F1B